VALYRLSPLAFPVSESSRVKLKPQLLAEQLAGLGYPGFAYVRPRRKSNPAQVLLAALSQPDLEARLTEALPWVVYRYPEMDWEWLLLRAKQFELQNRLGYVTHLARRLAETRQEKDKAAALAETESRLDRARLVREDTLCRESLSAAERAWLRDHRPPAARHWNLLCDLAPEHLDHAA
jgi:hypothetical protein